MVVAGEELKKCPFCGGMPEFWYWLDNYSCSQKYIANGRLHCNNCKIKIEEHKDFPSHSKDNPGIVFNEITEALVRRWNRRTDGTVMLENNCAETMYPHLDKDGCVYWDKFIK